jgi:para-aminobenzoate synthetase component 1
MQPVFASSRSDAAAAEWRRPLGPAELVLRAHSTGGTLCAASEKLPGEGGEVLRRFSNPLAALEWMQHDAAAAEEPVRWAGYFSYDLGRYFERLPATAADDLQLPLFVFTRHRPAASPVAAGAEASATQSGRALARDLRSNFTRAQYMGAVARAVEYIAAGDIFQVNLSQRFIAIAAASPLEMFQRLQQRFPASYAALLDYGDHALVCNSPELFLAVEPRPGHGRRVLTRPIKGTRPRTPGMEAQLRESIKDAAELHMIVDLERNDLGRVCEIGSVRVSQPRDIETHPTVYHGVATVEGQLRPEVQLVDLLRATFPGGSITGAPKIRAMEIIEELEPQRRGPYCGAIGYVDSSGAMQFNIAIRTLVVAQGRVHIPVGGGIVADSVPADEYEETLVKARAALVSLGLEHELQQWS